MVLFCSGGFVISEIIVFGEVGVLIMIVIFGKKVKNKSFRDDLGV